MLETQEAGLAGNNPTLYGYVSNPNAEGLFGLAPWKNGGFKW
ncbi:hypothetical protein [Lysinibacillus agricola]